jgi:hypothetical protein
MLVLEFVHIGMFKMGCRADFLVPILSWSKPPHHVKVNPLGDVTDSKISFTTSSNNTKHRQLKTIVMCHERAFYPSNRTSTIIIYQDQHSTPKCVD